MQCCIWFIQCVVLVSDWPQAFFIHVSLVLLAKIYCCSTINVLKSALYALTFSFRPKKKRKNIYTMTYSESHSLIHLLIQSLFPFRSFVTHNFQKLNFKLGENIPKASGFKQVRVFAHKPLYLIHIVLKFGWCQHNGDNLHFHSFTLIIFFSSFK